MIRTHKSVGRPLPALFLSRDAENIINQTERDVNRLILPLFIPLVLVYNKIEAKNVRETAI